MELTKSTIINNFEWILAQQFALDILKINNYLETMKKIVTELNELDIPIIKINADEIIYKPRQSDFINHEYFPIYELFIKINSIQENKLTYLPNIIGIYLLIESKN